MVQGNESWLETYWRLTIGEKYWRQLLLSCFLGKPICSIGEAKKWRNWFESSRALNCGIATVFGNMWFDLLVPLSCSQYQERLHLLVFRANLQLEYFSGCNIVQCFFLGAQCPCSAFSTKLPCIFFYKKQQNLTQTMSSLASTFGGKLLSSLAKLLSSLVKLLTKLLSTLVQTPDYFFTAWFFLGQFSCSNSANTCWFCLSK